MGNIFEVRDLIEETVSRYETVVRAAIRFFLALLALSVVNSRLGYMERLDSTTIVVAVSLLCALLPAGMIVFFSSLFIILHCYALSLEAAIVVLAVFLLMFLLYFRFTPKDTMAVLLTPLSFVFGIPHVMPVIYGLKGTPLSALSVGFGVVAYYTVDFVSDSEKMIRGMSDNTTVERFRAILDGVMKNNTMVAYVIAFAITVVIVSIVRRLSIPHAWTIAIAAGIVTDMIALMMLSLRIDADINIGGLFIGSLIAALIAFVYKLFAFSVDYAKTERVQFEDDGYYYYVKAVPKIKSRRRRSKRSYEPDED
ncbi:MAG: hypothetical protein IJV16_01740 [Lachnospiraceae bacterium]|nr:hypothetical protein [Lachnospiraceae bacterium]